MNNLKIVKVSGDIKLTSKTYKRKIPKQVFIEIVNLLQEFFKDYLLEENDFIKMFDIIGYSMRFVNGNYFLNSSFKKRALNLMGLYTYIEKFVDENDVKYYRIVFQKKSIEVSIKDEDIKIVEDVLSKPEHIR